MKLRENNDNAVKYLGWALIAIIVFVGMYALATLGHDTYITFSKEKIEVQATNSNSVK